MKLPATDRAMTPGPFKRVRAKLTRPDGTPWPYASVLSHVVDLIREASAKGVSLRLTAEEVRALDWAVIREEGGIEADYFRQSDQASLDEYFDETGAFTDAGRAALSLAGEKP